MARSVVLDSKVPILDERIMLDSSVSHHLSFVSPDSLSEFIVEDIAAEVAFLRGNSPQFASIMDEHEKGTIIGEDGLLRSLKRLYFPDEPMFTLSKENVDHQSRRDTPSLNSHTSNDQLDLSPDEERLLMDADGWLPFRISNGSLYVCRMPRPGDPELEQIAEERFSPKKKSTDNEKDSSDQPTSETSEAKLVVGQKLPSSIREELSRRMKGDCITKNLGWWTYEVCWEEHVRQYHSENGQTSSAHFLGHGPNKKLKFGSKYEDVIYRVDSVRGPYLSALFKNGSKCDVTGEPRVTEIRLYCEEEAAKLGPESELTGEMATAINLYERKLDISEQETCTYLVWWGTPKACLKQIKKDAGPIFGIRCRNVDDL